MTARCRLATFVALLIVAAFPLLAEGTTSGPKSVLAYDLENGTEIMGILGLPLGRLASVRARIVKSDAKETDQYVEILGIDGKTLSKSLQLTFSVWQGGNLANRSLPLNQELSLRVYETGGMIGVPERAMKETTYVASVGWGFSTSIVLLYEEK